MSSYQSYRARRESKGVQRAAWIAGSSLFLLVYALSWTWVV